MPTIETFTIQESTKYSCIGPFDAALRASVELKNNAPLPDCWTAPPSAGFGGTVLVHDVDMRVPVGSGKWHATQLLNQQDSLAGGMVWHESVGGAEDAVKLIKEMENAGGVVICNIEPPEVLQQGIRFIGRYSWDKNKQVELEFLESKNFENAHSIFGKGPNCYFIDPTTIEEKVLPDIESRVTGLSSFVTTKVDELKASGAIEQYPEQLHYSVLYGTEYASEMKQYTLPTLVNYDNHGVGFSFPQQEYLFGRLWFADDADHNNQCIAFCFYTYASPEYFGLMKLGDIPICPLLPSLKVDPTVTGGRYREPMDILAEKLIICSNVELKAILSDLTIPLRQAFFLTLSHAQTEERIALITRIFGGDEPLVPMTLTIFNEMFLTTSFTQAIEPTMLAILSVTSDEILQAAGEAEQARCRTLQARLLDYSYPFHEINDKTMHFAAHSHLSCHIPSRPKVVLELLRRDYPVNSILAHKEAGSDWFHTILVHAILCCEEINEDEAETIEAKEEAKQRMMLVKLLIEGADADVDETIGQDDWNAMVYVASIANESLLQYFRTCFPDHPIWTSTTIPLQRKEFPRINLFRMPLQQHQTEEEKEHEKAAEIMKIKTELEAVGPMGTIEDIFTQAKEEKRKREEEDKERKRQRDGMMFGTASASAFGVFSGENNDGGLFAIATLVNPNEKQPALQEEAAEVTEEGGDEKIV